MSRIRSDFWVAAYLRRCAGEGIDAVLRRRGAAEAGAIFVSLDRLDGRVDLYGPAPAMSDADGPPRAFAGLLVETDAASLGERMRREIGFDPDLWWVSVDDRLGRSLLDIVPNDDRRP